MKLRGIVVKIKDSHCLVLASDGTYHKVPLSRHKGARVGSEIEFALNSWLQYVKPALLVASILLVALGLSLFQQSAIPAAFAYVSLDINPSVELAVGADLKVISAHPLNQDAENLLAHVNISGKQLYASVNSILAEAVQEGFIKPGQKNYVLSTVTLEKNAPAKNIDYETLAGEMRSAVQDKGVEVELVVLSTDRELRQEAKDKGLSTGKLAVYRQAVAARENVTLQQVKDNSITNLVNKYKIKLVPADKKMIIKSLEIKPQDIDEDRHQTLEKSPGQRNEGTDKDSEKEKPDRHRNPDDNKQVSAPDANGRDDDIDIDEQSSAQEKDNVKTNIKDDVKDNLKDSVKDNEKDNLGKNDKTRDRNQIPVKDNSNGYTDSSRDSNDSSSNDNSNISKDDEKKNDVERDEKSDSDKWTPGDNNNSQQDDRNSDDNHGPR